MVDENLSIYRESTMYVFMLSVARALVLVSLPPPDDEGDVDPQNCESHRPPPEALYDSPILRS